MDKRPHATADARMQTAANVVWWAGGAGLLVALGALVYAAYLVFVIPRCGSTTRYIAHSGAYCRAHYSPDTALHALIVTIVFAAGGALLRRWGRLIFDRHDDDASQDGGNV